MSVAQRRALALSLAALVLLALKATGASLAWAWRAAALALVAGAVPVLAMLLAPELEARPTLARWLRGVAGMAALVGVAVVRVPLVLAAAVAVPAAWLVADTVGRVRTPAAVGRWAEGLGSMVEGIVKLVWWGLWALALAFQHFPESFHRGMRALGLERPTPRIVWRDAGLRHLDAAVDAPAPTPPPLRPLVRADVPGVGLVRQLPEETPEGVRRWEAQTRAATALRRKMSELRSARRDVRFTRTISRADERGFVVTYGDGRSEGWVYDPASDEVVPGDIPWVLRLPPPRE